MRCSFDILFVHAQAFPVGVDFVADLILGGQHPSGFRLLEMEERRVAYYFV